MALRFPSEQLAYLCENARILVQRAAHHQNDLQALVAAAETEVRHAETALTYALGEAEVPASRLRSLLSSHLQQRVHGADAARQLCIGAGEQHGVASRLLALLEAGSRPDAHPDEGPRHDAVLVVDDYRPVRDAIASVLQSAGFVVRTACNGLEALLAAYEMRPAVIVMDVTMPVLDGIEATRLIKAIDTTRHARVIAYTGDAGLDDTPLNALFAAVVKKPALPSVVLATVRRVASA
jgi:two-component system, cell cycle response regulator DivK